MKTRRRRRQGGDEDKEETKRALKIRIKEHKAATRRGETEKSAIAEHTWDNNTQYCGRRPALLVTVASYLLASLTVLYIHMYSMCSNVWCWHWWCYCRVNSADWAKVWLSLTFYLNLLTKSDVAYKRKTGLRILNPRGLTRQERLYTFPVCDLLSITY